MPIHGDAFDSGALGDVHHRGAGRPDCGVQCQGGFHDPLPSGRLVFGSPLEFIFPLGWHDSSFCVTACVLKLDSTASAAT